MKINECGTKTWVNSKVQLHRTDGPAVEYKDGEKCWYINGRQHRINGPAVEIPDGDKGWHVNNKFLGWNEEGFWALWDRLTPEQKQDPVLLSYLPGDFNV
jgi:hypothetical protein